MEIKSTTETSGF